LRLENWASTRCNLSFADQPFAADAKKYPKKGMGQANQITVADFGIVSKLEKTIIFLTDML
jgi:hypothetical protein